jgi:hypothetical protein
MTSPGSLARRSGQFGWPRQTSRYPRPDVNENTAYAKVCPWGADPIFSFLAAAICTAPHGRVTGGLSDPLIVALEPCLRLDLSGLDGGGDRGIVVLVLVGVELGEVSEGPVERVT